MLLKYKKTKLILLTIIIIIAGCAQKRESSATYIGAEEIVQEIYKNNPEYCGYIGSVIVKITAPESRTLRLKINKTCQNNIDFFVSSYFGLIIAKGSYKNGILEYSSPYGDSQLYESAGLKAIKALEKYLDIPHRRPSKPHYYSRLPENEYLFASHDSNIFVDSHYKIYKIVIPTTDEVVSYKYDGDTITSIELITEEIEMSLEFQKLNSQWTIRQ